VSEGIQVHGHWVIEVRDPDGTLATRREFENSLTSMGRGLVTDLMYGSASAGPWRIQLQGTLCVTGAGCFIVESGDPLTPNPNAFATLTELPGDPDGLQLTGSAIAIQQGTVTSVNTQLLSCSPATSPCDHSTPPSDTDVLTTAGVPGGPVSVEAGQQVQVNVVFSFS
jgi:hypothetical protein